MTRTLVEQSVRVPHCEEHHGESSQSPNQRHRSRPRLRSPDASLDRSSSTAGTLAGTARGLWDDSTDHQISLASTSDPLERHTSSLSAPEAVLTTGSRNATYTTIQRGIGTTDGPTTMRSLLSLRKSFHHILRGNVQRTSMSYRYTIPGKHHVTNNNSNTNLGVRCRATRFRALRLRDQSVSARNTWPTRQKWCCSFGFVVRCFSSVRTNSTPVVVEAMSCRHVSRCQY